MCTGICHDIYCANHPACLCVLYKDRNAAPGHYCKTARRRGRPGLCKTGLVWSTYPRVSPDEVCVVCELADRGRGVGGGAPVCAEFCDEAAVDPLEDLFGPGPVLPGRGGKFAAEAAAVEEKEVTQKKGAQEKEEQEQEDEEDGGASLAGDNHPRRDMPKGGAADDDRDEDGGAQLIQFGDVAAIKVRP